MKTVYIAGPMTGLPGNNYPAFNAVANQLRQQGYKVENPAESSPPACGTWEGWMRLGIEKLIRCQALVLLPGWRESRGARIEHHLALDLGLEILAWGNE